MQERSARQKLFSEPYTAAEGAVIMNNKDGKISLSKYFDIARSVVHGDIIIPIFFILPSIQPLNQLIKTYDKSGTGVSVGHIKDIRMHTAYLATRMM